MAFYREMEVYCPLDTNIAATFQQDRVSASELTNNYDAGPAAALEKGKYLLVKS